MEILKRYWSLILAWGIFCVGLHDVAPQAFWFISLLMALQILACELFAILEGRRP